MSETFAQNGGGNAQVGCLCDFHASRVPRCLAHRDPRAIKGLLVLRARKAIRGRPALPARWGQKASKDFPARKVLRPTKDHLVRKVPKGEKGDKGEQGSGGAGLHVVRQETCDGSCDLARNAGEALGSVTCPQGQVSITKNGDTETASCSQTHGPALALCVRP